MTLVEFLILLLIAAICGAAGQALAGYSLGGLLTSIVVGFVGAFLGMWLARQFGLPEWIAFQVGDRTFPIVWSIVGSAVLALLVGMLTRPARPARPVV
ncbi:MAG: GlsB/YeaQ/YmgE family stress response membrane protein [Litorilinea sp.]